MSCCYRANVSTMNHPRTDTDMMDTDTSLLQQLPPPVTASGGQNQNAAVWELLTLARQFINEGNPSKALQSVVMAMRTKGGDGAVIHSLSRAREQYINRMQERSSVDQLASLFAECAIAEASEPVNLESPPPSCNMSTDSSIAPSSQGGASILAETGRDQIVLDAVSDGSSFICLQCGGLVSKHRKDEHYAYWCGDI